MASWRVALIALAVVGAMTSAPSAQARRVTPPQEAATLFDLKPKTVDQIVRAEFFLSDWNLRVWTDRRPLVATKSVCIDWIFCPPAGVRLLTAAEALEAAVCRSPVVIVAEAMSSQTFLLADETGLFSDFGVVVHRWIRPASGDREIQVSMLGGRAVVSGSLRLSFEVNYFVETRQIYLMFLEWSEAAKAYLVKREPAPIAGGKIIVSFNPAMTLEDEDSFLKQLSSAAALCK